MKAMVIRKFGGPEVFERGETAEPAVGPGTVLIQVKASSVNPVDAKIRAGQAPALVAGFPAVLHGDVSGIVLETGPNVKDFKAGDEVFGMVGGYTTPGVLAERVVADVRLIVRKPKSLSFEQAAALPLVSITAWEALIDRAKIQPGDRVLVHAGAGGVGHLAIQLAKLQGAQVHTTVSSADKAEIAHSLGADQTIDYRKESVPAYVDRLTGGRGYDVVFDTLGGENLDRSFQSIRSGGQVVSIVTLSTHDLSPLHLKGASLHVVMMLGPVITGNGRERHGEILRRVSELVDAGKLRPWVDSRKFGFTQVGQAHAALEAGKAIGKIALTNDL